ncbi:MAG: DNA-directed RNA polymerase subunit beta' [Alphaproteobacteria bacterium]|nr:DNA-directed RNA polymerase subunit beta' [Alphaproteobacteria bacterium]MBL0717783.1 DNA-directed RNA polymerase subunit beta' [Alphaproteobacteria bacterium]
MSIHTPNFFNSSTIISEIVDSSAGAMNSVVLRLASPEQILAQSYGEVVESKTINYRTFKPERGGLFCAKIFGPISDFECLCGKYKKPKNKGIICEKCGVEITQSSVRRERMGHIELATPVVHPWFMKSSNAKIATLMGVAPKKLEAVLYYDLYIVIESGLTPLESFSFLTQQEVDDAIEEHGSDAFDVGMGAEAILKILKNIDLESEKISLGELLTKSKSIITRQKIIKKLRIIESFIDSGVKPAWMVLTVLPVLAPELRPLMQLEMGRMASSDLNDLYRRIINRNTRLKRLLQMGAPGIIVNNEKRMLQEAVDELISGSKNNPAGTVPMKSLTDTISQKSGRWRSYMLGKRVDYSGRSVIVPGPFLKLHQVGVPKLMALELFKPFVIAKLLADGENNGATTVRNAQRMIEARESVVFDKLAEVIKQHPVMLNRAPTLHKFSILAFDIVLVEGKAICLHPLVCSGFNADFDGDQMAIHVPLSIEAQEECRTLIHASQNILSTATGNPMCVPTQDMLLGLYYISLEAPKEEKTDRTFYSLDDLKNAYQQDKISIHTKVFIKLDVIDKNQKYSKITVNMSLGRLLIWDCMPVKSKESIAWIDKIVNKKVVEKSISSVYDTAGLEATVEYCDKLKDLGFEYACISGTSMTHLDIEGSVNKEKFIEDTKIQTQKFESQYQQGLVSSSERSHKMIEAWSNCNAKIQEDLKNIFVDQNSKNINSIFMMSDSGARGSATQFNQLAGMRGLMSKPSGEIIATPITSNLKEGLSPMEYFMSTHGARKGMADTATKTARSGYLTRRLVSAAQDVIITEQDCGTEDFLEMRAIYEGMNQVVSLKDRIINRVLAVDIIDPTTNKIILERGEIILPETADIVFSKGVESVKVRSAVCCKCERGICSKCYGIDLARKTLVNVGEAVGIIAAQSIGEPGTQLTMRTFHIGGVAQYSAEKNSIDTPIDAKVQFLNAKSIKNDDDKIIVLSRNAEMVLLNSNNQEALRQRIPYGSILTVQDGANVQKGDRIVEWDAHSNVIFSQYNGIVKFKDLIENVSVMSNTDETTGVQGFSICDWKRYTRKHLRPRITLLDDKGEAITHDGKDVEIILPINAELVVEEGDTVKVGSVLFKLPIEMTKTRDIIGGLSQIERLFDVNNPKYPAVIAEKSGEVIFGESTRIRQQLIIKPTDGSDDIIYMLPKGSNFLVQSGDFVNKGDLIINGEPHLGEYLRVMGIKALTQYLTQQVQEVFRSQGVSLNDKHIEIIIRQMVRQVKIINPGDTKMLTGERFDRRQVEKINEEIETAGGRPATFITILLGIKDAVLNHTSFLAAASFQRTIKVLSDSAVKGDVDNLEGVLENVMMGQLPPLGTGFYTRTLRKELKDMKDISPKLEGMFSTSQEESPQKTVENNDEVPASK